jgi:DNA-directed RNA polymerase subunit RPC12/RpoP
MSKSTDRATLKLLYGTDNPVTIIKQKSDKTKVQRRAFAGGNEGNVTLTAEQCKELCKGANNFQYTAGDEGRVLSYVVTDETVDRYGDIVRAKGVNFLNYHKNPVVQFAHNYDQPPVGVSIRTWYDAEKNCVRSWALFYSKEVDSSGRADLIFRIANANGMRACSIGFMAVETNRPQKSEEREAMGLGEWGVEFLVVDMMEFSPCPVPANPNCLSDSMKSAYRSAFVKDVESGLFTRADVELLAEYPLFVETGSLDALIKKIGAKVISVPTPVQKEITLDSIIKDLDEIKPDPATATVTERIATIPEPAPAPAAKATDEPESDADEKIEAALLAFLVDNPNPTDEAMHAWAQGAGYDVPKVESMAYEMATLWARLAAGPGGKVDPASVDQDALAQGILNEYEHTVGETPEDRIVAQTIALPHIAENPDYYEEIDEMENEPDEPETDSVKCSKCGKQFEYSKQPEIAMGSVKCPHCGETVNQEGKRKDGAPSMPADEMDHLASVICRKLAPAFEKVHGRIDSTHGSLKRMHEKADTIAATHETQRAACHGAQMEKLDNACKSMNDLHMKADTIHGHTSGISQIQNQLDNLESTLNNNAAAAGKSGKQKREGGNLYLDILLGKKPGDKTT